MISRTGYTGELGFEVWCHPQDALSVWDAIWEVGQPHGLMPLGLDALDMVRIEAGLVFADMNSVTKPTPLKQGSASPSVENKEDDFVGKSTLINRKANPQRKLVGLELQGNEPGAHGDCVHLGRAQVGIITSGMLSPFSGKTSHSAEWISLTRKTVLKWKLGNWTVTRKESRQPLSPFPSMIQRRQGYVHD
ncbi:MAG: hypothetical protein CM15mP66_02050 [Pseudomonadota bacterium]|nr:MAG: hypothetical protein CM15mP66_02050 [Pseudomonadota bacterium]